MDKRKFSRGYAQLVLYLTGHASIDIDEEYKTSEGIKLGEWLKEVRNLWKLDLLSEKQIYLLEQIGVAPEEKLQSWESMYRYAKNYYIDFGVLPNGMGYRTEEGIILGAWIDRQKRFGCMLLEEQKKKLFEIGIDVEVYGDVDRSI